MFPDRARTPFVAILALSVSLLLLGLFVLLLSPGTTQAQTQPEALGSVRGTVHNAQGTPLPNIVVTLRQLRVSEWSRQTTSNSAGIYAFNALPSGTYILQFSDPNKHYATHYYGATDFPHDATQVVVNGNDVSNVNMELATAGAISLTVQSAYPVSTTDIMPQLYRQTHTGTWLIYRALDDGLPTRDFLLDGLPAGNYRLCVTLLEMTIYQSLTECYENVSPQDVDEPAVDATDITIQAGQTRNLVIDMDDNAQVEGTILSPGNTPLADIYMTLIGEFGAYHFSVASDSNGHFRFPPVPAGNYQLIFNTALSERNRYLPLYYPNAISIVDAGTLQITADSHISITQKMRPASTITGKVTLPEGVPVDYAYFTIFRQWRDGSFNPFYECLYTCIPSERYDPQTGVYTITHLIPGNYRIGVNYTLPNMQTPQFQFYGGDSLDQADTIVLDNADTASNINIEVGKGQFDGAFTGQVTAGGQPVAGIEVGLFLPYYGYDNRGVMPLFTTRTDADGRYTLEGLAAGYYLIGARDLNGIYATAFYGQAPSPQDHYPVTIPGEMIWLSHRETRNGLDLRLEPGATIRGHVRIQGKSRGDFIVQAIPHNNYYNDPYYSFPYAYSDARTDATGNYAITGLISGTYYLRALQPFYDGSYFGPPLFYPGTYNSYETETVTVTTGQTLEARDFWLYTSPTNFLPVINSRAAANDGQDNFGPPPTPTPMPPGPMPTPTPTPTFRATGS